MKVIIAEDDPVTLLLITEKLTSWGYNVLTAKDGLEVLELVRQNSDVQLFLLDWQMPNLDGMNLCVKLKHMHSLANFYIIMLTSRRSTENIVLALESGADDFIPKPFVAEELKVRLKVGRRIIDTENRLMYQAMHDPLTNIFNNRAIVDELSRLFSQAARVQNPFALMMLDLDYFKRINDKYGHIAGDEALQQFCQSVQSEIRPYDMFGRYGGEEFTLCLPSTDADQALSTAERIRKRVATTLIEYDGQRFNLTVSIGIAMYSENHKSKKEMLIAADKAVYEAKSKGRNRVVMYSD